jgi:hypothetical protein
MQLEMKSLTCCLLAACAAVASGCCPPDSISIIASRVDGECVLDLDYEGTALGIYVSEPKVTAADSHALGKDVEYPRGPDKFEGIVFFGLDTTTFPDGIVPPVRYGDTTKPRSQDTKNGYMHSDDPAYNKKDPVTQQTPYALTYPMPLINSEEDCTRCQLSMQDDQGLATPDRTVGAFKIGIVTVPGNTEVELSAFSCPTGAEPIQYGTDLTPHFGAD